MLYILFLQYTNKYHESCLKKLKEIIVKKLNNISYKIIEIDNSIFKDIEVKYSIYHYLISGNNSTYEFSGWDKGIQFCEREFKLKQDDLFLFVNDTFNRNYDTKYLNNIHYEELPNIVRNNEIWGYVDAYPKEIKIFDLPINFWIRTSFFILSYESAKKLYPFSIQVPNEDLFSSDYNVFFSTTLNISENYKQYLRTWLFGDKDIIDEFQESWHSQRKLDINSFSFFKGKAKAILSEHYFSARALNLGFKFIRLN